MRSASGHNSSWPNQGHYVSVLFSAPRSWVALVSIKGCWRRLSSITNNRYDKLRLLAFVLIWKENSNLGSSFSHFYERFWVALVANLV
ncbi:hypothetical protein L3X38_014814 [Prunus dulcis]|uniref:Uncharacterized protein n=1 Tax=Prunus dulcis TaxID=3755 RepID=A0AAD4WNW7_PRUDU|nr:hypothetical protein L3X38_014814 [Prunus dulcis]